jgi:hypothetical protein
MLDAAKDINPYLERLRELSFVREATAEPPMRLVLLRDVGWPSEPGSV